MLRYVPPYSHLFFFRRTLAHCVPTNAFRAPVNGQREGGEDRTQYGRNFEVATGLDQIREQYRDEVLLKDHVMLVLGDIYAFSSEDGTFMDSEGEPSAMNTIEVCL